MNKLGESTQDIAIADIDDHDGTAFVAVDLGEGFLDGLLQAEVEGGDQGVAEGRFSEEDLPLAMAVS